MFDTLKNKKFFHYSQNLKFGKNLPWNLNFLWPFQLDPSQIRIGKWKMFWEIFCSYIWTFEQCVIRSHIERLGFFYSLLLFMGIWWMEYVWFAQLSFTIFTIALFLRLLTVEIMAWQSGVLVKINSALSLQCFKALVLCWLTVMLFGSKWQKNSKNICVN